MRVAIARPALISCVALIAVTSLLAAPTAVETPSNVNHSVALSPDGKLMATASYTHVHVWDLSRREIVRSVEKERGDVYRMIFTQSGRRLVISNNTRIEVYSTDEWKLIRSMEPDERDYLFHLAVSEATGTVAAGGDRLYVWDLATGESRFVAGQPANEVAALATSPDGRTVAVIHKWTGGTIDFRDARSGATRQSHRTGLGHVDVMRYSPDGSRVAVAALGGKIRIVSPAGVELAAFEMPASINALAFSPDGRRLAGGSWKSNGGEYVWVHDLAAGRTISSLGPVAEPFYDVVFARGSSRLIAAVKGKSLYFWAVD